MTPSEIKRKIKPVLKKNGVKRAGLFGSYARGEANKNNEFKLSYIWLTKQH
ncbi:MAG: nucleotidyltransferase domain-containing protein [bacterium]|nr:nucleotidyltransferase domain-containing protein [bacterium]